jgi:hypothetical protein
MTNNKQQTAVQWFLDQLIEHRIIIVDKTTYQVKYKHRILLEQANERHKQQIVNAVDDQNNYDSWPSSIPTLGEQYYNETYGGGEQ